MTQLAQFLQPEMRVMVLDETGVTGEYSFQLDHDSVDGQERVPPGFPETETSLYTTSQEQLGLKLESVRDPVEHLVIDYTEKPSGN